MNLIIKRTFRAFALTKDLIENLSEEDLTLSLPDLPSNKIGEQIWCIIGARESYFNAIKQESWAGFSCSLKSATSKAEIIMSLDASSKKISDYLENHDLNYIQLEFLMDILEHEIQHHGQLIRYVYGNKLKFPKSWNERYTV